MANSLYGLGREKFLRGEIAYHSDTIKALLTTSGYSPGIDVDEFLSAIASGNRIKISEVLSGKTTALGVAGAGATKVKRVNGNVHRVVLHKSTGTDSTSALIAHYDTGNGLPSNPKGSDVKLKWQTTDPKVFKL